MTQEERREAILKTAIPLFAEKGFHGVKTKELAQAAGVSEALVFQHFPSKEALFEAVQQFAHGPEEESELAGRFLSLPSSSEKLMLGIHLILDHLTEDAPPEEKVMPRLMMQSLLDDGALARRHLGRFEREWWPVLVEALRSAREAGEAVDVGTPEMLLVWFFHHVGFAIRILKLPGTTIDYGIPTPDLVEYLGRFLLRGMGVREEVIQTKYNVGDLLRQLG